MAERDGDPISVLLLTGGVATGKTTIAAEIGEVLAGAGRSIVIVDLDHLGWGFIPDSREDLIEELRTDNLGAIWPNLQAAGFQQLVITGAVVTTATLASIREIVGSSMVVVRVVTPPDLAEERLRQRDNGRLLDDHLAIMPSLEQSLDRSGLEDVRIDNDDRSPREVAASVLERIGWADAP